MFRQKQKMKAEEVRQNAMKLLCEDLTEAKKQLIEKDAKIKSLEGFNEMQLDMIADLIRENAGLKRRLKPCTDECGDIDAELKALKDKAVASGDVTAIKVAEMSDEISLFFDDIEAFMDKVFKYAKEGKVTSGKIIAIVRYIQILRDRFKAFTNKWESDVDKKA